MYQSALASVKQKLASSIGDRLDLLLTERIEDTLNHEVPNSQNLPEKQEVQQASEKEFGKSRSGLYCLLHYKLDESMEAHPLI